MNNTKFHDVGIIVPITIAAGLLNATEAALRAVGESGSGGTTAPKLSGLLLEALGKLDDFRVLYDEELG